MGFGNKADTSAPWGSLVKFKIYPAAWRLMSWTPTLIILFTVPLFL